VHAEIMTSSAATDNTISVTYFGATPYRSLLKGRNKKWQTRLFCHCGEAAELVQATERAGFQSQRFELW
jgi:hypothetical protein